MAEAVLKVCVWHDEPAGKINEQSPDIGHSSLSSALARGWKIKDVVSLGDGDHVRVIVEQVPTVVHSALLDVYTSEDPGRIFHLLGASESSPPGEYIDNWTGAGWKIQRRGITWASPPYGNRELIWLVK